ncbi:hypothetical protein HOU02_gp330 [Caulobacter phage CcrBL9]|uniref:Uncharacterized protein n=1 Tax=Caulobacter phage CcrBL9 TaxID=2283270 RepID=A0A385EED8_9CAUD|nr:hypothetical protein HOU02_gp330 [Caulobacter phage CcrBL9]AXQ69395.1 hypothetical protein CcrBL9_gp371 [Caulobacter phage CcrBL9]
MADLLQTWDRLDAAIQRVLTSTIEDVSPRAQVLDTMREEMRDVLQQRARHQDLIVKALEAYDDVLKAGSQEAADVPGAQAFIAHNDHIRLKIAEAIELHL